MSARAANRAEKRVGENLPNKKCFQWTGPWKPAWRLGFSRLAAKRAPVPLVGANSTRPPVVLDLFGGRTSQTPGAINVDIVATEGVRASALQLPFKDGAAGTVIATNPYLPGASGMADFLPEATRVLQPGGQMIINSTARNPFGTLPSQQFLDELGLTVVQDRGPLLQQFQNNTFRFTDGRPIPNSSVFTTVLKKAGGN